VQEALGVDSNHMIASHFVLSNYGNLSGSSNLIVLDHVRKLDTPRRHIVGISFGPGIGVELILFRA
jgi:predicted naringenin-chalcone synthase